MSKLLSTKTFIISQSLILVISLIFLGLLHYLVNIQYQENQVFSLKRGPVTRPPATLTLEVSSPDENSLVFEPQILISGKTLPNLQVIISSEYEDIITQVKPDGRFSADFPLKEGVNNIEVVVFDRDGEQKFLKRLVFYSKEKI